MTSRDSALGRYLYVIGRDALTRSSTSTTRPIRGDIKIGVERASSTSKMEGWEDKYAIAAPTGRRST